VLVADGVPGVVVGIFGGVAVPDGVTLAAASPGGGVPLALAVTVADGVASVVGASGAAGGAWVGVIFVLVGMAVNVGVAAFRPAAIVNGGRVSVGDGVSVTVGVFGIAVRSGATGSRRPPSSSSSSPSSSSSSSSSSFARVVAVAVEVGVNVAVADGDGVRVRVRVVRACAGTASSCNSAPSNPKRT
jgi:hypothetical protein